jgi:hypothetical protein
MIKRKKKRSRRKNGFRNLLGMGSIFYGSKYSGNGGI